ncbi:MAG: hypothetical protein GF349_04670 [Candidatus Magasanikbacteria bacterium]|nr:hypothetical protein [Candidatus Magasanikbacteria bacterium]
MKKIIEVHKESGKIRLIKINRQKCIGAQSCVVVAPKTFQVDEENLAYVVDPNAHSDEDIILAAQSCPVLAIELYNKEGGRIFPEE